MNYRHIYHAGNFADIIKHLTLISILGKLRSKESPFAVLDSFAGSGSYDLASELALKTSESCQGIKKLITHSNIIAPSNIPNLLQEFINIVKVSNNSSIYPGSPLFIQHMLRPDDRLIMCELHPEEYAALKKLLRVDVHNMDGYLALKAFLPFKENRGLILLDPPFEVTSEFNKLLDSLNIIKKRARSICILIWYPIKNAKEVSLFYQNYQTIGYKETLKIEFEIFNYHKNMNKCGVLVINPPNIKDEIKETMRYITKYVYLNQAYCNIEIIQD